MNRKGYLKAGAVVLVLFAIGLVGYFAFSAAFRMAWKRSWRTTGWKKGNRSTPPP